MSPYLKTGVAILGVLLPAVFGVATLQEERSDVFVSNVAFEPSPAIADKRVRISIDLKNTGHVKATIERIAIEKFGGPETDPIYDLAYITDAVVPAGGEIRIISDLGQTAFNPSQSEINTLKFFGFIEYDDILSPPLGKSVLKFCYAWDPHDTAGGNFSACAERQYVSAYRYWLSDGLRLREVPSIHMGSGTVSPTTTPFSMRDPNYPVQHLEVRKKK
jgi:hypothetical protein